MRYLILFFLFCSFQSAETVLSSMTTAEKIGQLFVIPACPERGPDHLRDLKILLKEYHIGGVILKQGNSLEYRMLMNTLNAQSQHPLLYYADAEWGLGMRIHDAISFPQNHILGLIKNDALLTKLGKEIGKQCRSLGIHVNLGPVVDINSNPLNPIINKRSFSHDPHVVAQKAVAFMNGLQDAHIMACAKHFPGHGDTCTDSHHVLPVLLHDRERLLSFELIPFQAMMDHKVPLIMTAHLFIPSLSKEPGTFSYEIVTKLLKHQLGFQGLVITDALNMKALTDSYEPGEIGLRAFLAGHDLLLYGDHIAPNIDDILRRQIPEAYRTIMDAYAKGIITESELNHRVLKILKAKETLQPPTYDELCTEEALLLKDQLIQESQNRP